MSGSVLVTGATGTVGVRTVAALAKKPNVKVRAAVRDPQKASRLPAGVTPVAFEWHDRSNWPEVLRDVETLFLLTPGIDDAITVGNALVDAAKSAGCKRVVSSPRRARRWSLA